MTRKEQTRTCLLLVAYLFWFFAVCHIWINVLSHVTDSVDWVRVRAWLVRTGIPINFFTYYTISVWIGFLFFFVGAPVFLWYHFNAQKRLKGGGRTPGTEDRHP